MSLIVEDGTGKVDAASYLSVADTAAYHTLMGNTAWDDADDEAKEPALIRATRYIDANFSFTGYKGSRAQALEWPRYGAYQGDWPLDANMIPQKLKDATAELALVELVTPGSLAPVIDDTAGAVKREKVDVLETEYFEPTALRPVYTVAIELLASLTSGGGSSRLRLRRS